MKKDSKTNSIFKSEVWAPVIVALLTLIVIAIDCVVESNWTMAYISYPLIVLFTIILIKHLQFMAVQYFDKRKRFVDEFLKE